MAVNTLSKEMEKLNHPAILVVDMLNDFVTGSIGCDRAVEILPATARLLEAAREKGVPVIYCNDAHLPGIDRELQIWGDHALVGTHGAEVVPELKPAACDYVVPKRRYSGFFQTDLDILLKELGVKTVVITGLHTHMCCRHTVTTSWLPRKRPIPSQRRTTSTVFPISRPAMEPMPTRMMN